MLLNSAEVSTVELAALGRRSAPRVAVTTTESAKFDRAQHDLHRAGARDRHVGRLEALRS